MTIEKLLLLATACLSTTIAVAQTTSTGALRGLVTDTKGAAIEGAQVTLTSTATDEARRVVT